MKHYFENYPPSKENDYLTTWTNSAKEWENASPIYFLNETTYQSLSSLNYTLKNKNY